MSLTIDQNMLYTIIVALFTYDIIRHVISIFAGALNSRVQKAAEGKSSPYAGSDRGPGGMVVKGIDSLRDSESSAANESKQA
jgi:hypothetical protein